jgi:hypothetical protein
MLMGWILAASLVTFCLIAGFIIVDFVSEWER